MDPVYTFIRKDILVGWNDRECTLLLIIILLVMSKLVSLLSSCLKRIIRKFITNRKSKIPQKDLLIIEKLRKKEADRISNHANNKFIIGLPPVGWKERPIIKRLEAFSEEEMKPLNEGKYSCSTYSTKRDIVELSEKASGLFLFTNIQFYARHQRSK